MTIRISKVAVLGSGVMGSGIAAHLANAGIPSLVFDLETPVDNVKGLLKHKPAPLLHPDLASLIEPCSFKTDLHRYAECDWIVEAVTERLDIKRMVFEKVREHAKPGTIVTSNTSGIPIAAMTEGTPEDFRKNFFVTHFFNPVRYMHLLEMVAGPETDPDVFAGFAAFGQENLGKGIVVGNDTPNFVANRIGTYGMMAILHKMAAYGMNVEQVDAIFGKPLGRPKSAVFRTADLVGLDTLAHVAANCRENLPDDDFRKAFELPSFLQKMLDQGILGDKTKGGFYKKTKDAAGKRQILALNLETLEYGEKSKVRFASTGAVRNVEDVGERVKTFLAQDDDAAKFAWDITADVLLYSAHLLGTIADDVSNIDRAMRWGFAWDQGPFQTWDAIGVAESVERMKAEGREIPAIVEKAVAAGSWYSRDGGVSKFLDATASEEFVAETLPKGAIVLQDLKEQGLVVKKNMGASLIDLGDGVLGLEFHTKMNSLDADIIGLYGEALDTLEASNDWQAMVVGNQDAQAFSAGANIFMVLGAAMQEDWKQIEDLTDGLQQTLMRAKNSRKPVVTAPHGLTLGGGLEVAMHSAATRASREMYAGLVEVGVGLLPAGGGCKELVFRLLGSVPAGVKMETSAILQQIFQYVGMAKVSMSAEEARDMGFLRASDGITMNPELLIRDAKQVALGLARSGYIPPRPRKVAALGTAGKAQLAAGIWGFVQAGQISEHDALIGNKIAHVISGGDVAPGTMLGEQHYLDLEREAFVSLCGTEKTQARIQHMLMKGKPLRN
ncbi:MAG: 3-hydroxyacyl-CoA dehydrogenase/enoyl-CoA hydratase family protein [Deltaproteobacteria bacterium]|nr:3-hydroxyacyl-CoA dehydrogenase/enoyl-CoA hydratase family protein [Deltaproteobacteria bacterium]